MKPISAAMLLAVVLPAPCLAQDTLAVTPYARVRLRFVSSQLPKFVGQLLEIGRDSLTAAKEEGEPMRRFARSDIAAIDVPAGRHVNVLQGIAVGAGVGVATAGLGIFLIQSFAHSCDDEESDAFFCFDPEPSRILLAIGTAALLGGWAGAEYAQDHPQEIWKPAVLPPSRIAVGPARRGFRVSLNFAF